MTNLSTDNFLQPERIIKYFDLEPGDHVADLGAGHGYFTIPMARIVGGNGKVYAVDVQKSVLDIIRTKAKLESLLNIEPLWADIDHTSGLKIKNEFIDFVLISNTLFQSENKEGVLREAYRMLRGGGKLAIIEWDITAPPPLGPPLALRINKDTIKNMAMKIGFASDREFEAGSHHYGLLFKKSKP